MAAAVAPTLLDLRVDLILPRMMVLLRLTQGMRIVKCRPDSEWEFSAGQVHFTAGRRRVVSYRHSPPASNA